MDLKRLEIVPNSEFNTVIRPNCIEDDGYIEAHKETINFHIKNRKLPLESIIQEWKDGVPEKEAFEHFDSYLKIQTGSIAPIAGGQNIRGYDLPIYERCINKYRIPYRFYRRDQLELLDFFSHWFMYAKKPPVNYKLDTMRKKFGMSMEGAHDALIDVQHTAEILVRFLRLHQRIIKNIKELNE